MAAEQNYLKPDVIRTIRRLDLKAQFIVKGFVHGLHSSPLKGFSVQFSEHRRYAPGDDPKDIDWKIFAKTDKYYVKKFEAETNLTGWLLVDTSRSMGSLPSGVKGPAENGAEGSTKFDYAICLAAALAYLMIQQQDPVGLLTFDQQLGRSVAPKSRRSQLASILSILTGLRPVGGTNIARALDQTAGLLRHASLVMVFSDLLDDQEALLRALNRLRHAGHDVILFHILDEAEVRFPFHGQIEFEDPESGQTLIADSDALRREYLDEIESFREELRRRCAASQIDYVPLDTSIPFDRGLTEYLIARSARQ